MSTAAPTSTNRITSAASHSLLNFSESLLDTLGTHRILSTQAMLTTASRPDTETMPLSQLSMDMSRNAMPSTMMTFMLLRTVWARA